jgi:hypothetical protein
MMADDGQTVFLFPGKEDYATDTTIIQPVLGWNAGFFGTNWSIASWNCCPSGTTHYSTPVQVNSGDIILGTIKSTCSAGTKSCSEWNITTEDRTTSKSTTLSKTPSKGQTFTWGTRRRAGGLRDRSMQRLPSKQIDSLLQSRAI